jgi:hypothetical protein
LHQILAYAAGWLFPETHKSLFYIETLVGTPGRHDFRCTAAAPSPNTTPGETVRTITGEPQMDEKLEKAQLLARFKLMVKRTLGQTVDLERLDREPAYARERLAEIEEAALDEDLLIMVLRLRDLVLPVVAPVADVMPVIIPAAEIPQESLKETRNYKMGARAW